MAITINGTGTITGISAGGLPDGSVTAADIESSLDLTGKTVTLPSGTGGKILQVVVTKILNPFVESSSNNSWVDLSGFSRSITTIGANSSFLIQTSLGIAKPTGNTVAFKIQRNNTDIELATNDQGNRPKSHFRVTDYGINNDHGIPAAHSFIDSPQVAAGTSLTYKLQGNHEGAGSIYINRQISYTDQNNPASAVTTSTIIVTEIAA